MTTEKRSMVLVYNRDRSFERQMPMTAEIKGLFKGSFKIFYHVTDNQDELLLHGPARWQYW